MSDKAHITPIVLKWARETAGMNLETAAGKVAGLTIEKLKEWEEGLNLPTIRQAQMLAKAYKRPFALFFLLDVPKDFLPLQDFRKPGAKPLTTSSIFIIREIQQKQSWISEVYKENQEAKLSFVGRFSLRDDPQIVAEDILKTLAIDPAKYRSVNPIKEWIDAAESKGIFVSRTSFIHSRLKLDAEELQGFAIADFYAPFIFVNSEDWNAPQLFTLVHELAHIWIAETGISNGILSEINSRDKFHPVELFCNKVAANALIPKNLIESFPLSAYKQAAEVFNNAKRLGVSSFAFLIRALNLNLISLDNYNRLRKEADVNYLAFIIKEEAKQIAIKLKQKEKIGGPNPYLLRMQKNSRLFTQIVLDSLKNGLVQPTEASSLLGTPASNLHKLEAQMNDQQNKYCLDANILIQAWQKYYSPEFVLITGKSSINLEKKEGFLCQRK